MSKKRVVIAIVNSSSFGISYPEHLRKLEEFADLIRVDIPNDAPASVFHEKLAAADGIITSVTPIYTRAVLHGLPKLQFLARHGVGCDNVDLKTCTELGIAVSKVGPQIERESVAQMALGLMDASPVRSSSASRWCVPASGPSAPSCRSASISMAKRSASAPSAARSPAS